MKVVAKEQRLEYLNNPTLNEKEKEVKNKIVKLLRKANSYEILARQLKNKCLHKIRWYLTDRSGHGGCLICDQVFGPNHPEFDRLMKERQNK